MSLPEHNPLPSYFKVALNDGGLECLDDVVNFCIVISKSRFGIDIL